MASFGRIPYGHTLMGRVYIPVEEYGCESFKENSNIDSQEPVIFLVKRGNCTFLEKTLHAQSAGASLILIRDDHEERVEAIRPDTPDAPHQNIRIPTLLLDRDETENLWQAVKSSQNMMSSEDKEGVIISVDFKLVRYMTKKN